MDERPARMLSAYFGLDHAMPETARGLCFHAPGQDGMPVTFSRRVVGPITPEAFTVRTKSGALHHPSCATTRPADGPAKDHTVLLIGDIGREPNDPPVSVEVTGHLALDGGDAIGLSSPVTPLADGPSMLMALAFRVDHATTDCPLPRTRQVVAVVWAGGVRNAPGVLEEAHRIGYRVTTRGGTRTPFALADLGDRDNYEHLCLDTDEVPERISFGAGLLIDPRGDANPETSVDVSSAR